MLTLLEIIKRTTDFFAGKGIDSPRLNAELLVGHALGLKRMQLYLQFERPMTEPELETIRPLVRRRGQQEPLQYVLGETEFCGLRLKVDRRALIPRPETEQLVEKAVAACATPPGRILDLGTGSGAIALALAKQYPLARVTGVDASNEALELARENAARVAPERPIEFVQSDWFSALASEELVQLIVANPPYLSSEETAATAAEVRGFEPLTALTAAEEGLGDLRRIIADARRFLDENGVLALETGIHQHAALRGFATAAGYSQIESHPDLAGRDRFVVLRR